MSNAFFKVPTPVNEPILSYGPGSNEKSQVKKALKQLKSSNLDIPMFIGGEKIFTKEKRRYKVGQSYHSQ